MPTPRKPHLLLCLDAFGTIFTPKAPIATQYLSVARTLSIPLPPTPTLESDLANSFRKSFKSTSSSHPNYGKLTGLTPEKWWNKIIVETFKGVGVGGREVEERLAPELVRRFGCADGYVLYEDVAGFLRGRRRKGGGRVVVGVVTNSDDRVVDVLGSLGVRVAGRRVGGEMGEGGERGEWDVEFCVMSYDVGFEKPDRRIFGAAVEMLKGMNVVRGTDVEQDWEMVYVGDEYEKDVVGAVDAGWKAVLVDREGQAREKKVEGVKWLDENKPTSLEEAFADTRAVGCGSLTELIQWLPSER